MKSRVFILLAFLLVSLAAYGDVNGSLKDRMQYYIQQEKKAPAAVKAVLKKLRAELKKRKASFEVGYTAVSHLKLSDITGYIPIRNFVETAKKQNETTKKIRAEHEKKRSGLSVLAPISASSEPEQQSSGESNEPAMGADKDNGLKAKLLGKWKSLSGSDEPQKPKPEPKPKPKPKPEPKPDIPKRPTKEPVTPTYKGGCTPSASRWSFKDRLPPVQSQGSCGSCWAFSAMATLEGSQTVVNNATYNFAEQQILDCAAEDDGRDAGNCKGGRYSSVFRWLSRSGAIFEDHAPYKKKEGTCSHRAPSQYQIAYWGWVDPYNKQPSNEKIKDAICKWGPVSAGIYSTPFFHHYRGGIFDEFASHHVTNHAINIVGWDDKKGAWLVRNSWGRYWGENGYAWVAYGSNSIGSHAAYAVASECDSGSRDGKGRFWTRRLKVKNSSSTPIKLSLRYLIYRGSDGWRWLPKTSGNAKSHLAYSLQPGQSFVLADDDRQVIRTRAVFLFAKAQAGGMEWNQFKDTYLDTVPDKGYVASDPETLTFEFESGGQIKTSMKDGKKTILKKNMPTEKKPSPKPVTCKRFRIEQIQFKTSKDKKWDKWGGTAPDIKIEIYQRGKLALQTEVAANTYETTSSLKNPIEVSADDGLTVKAVDMDAFGQQQIALFNLVINKNRKGKAVKKSDGRNTVEIIGGCTK
ncbi:MAG: hypothetical protein GY847_10645 [Proteobacteria bacterium]|nr:hypothetical protein [Pseudomonadota bacterium]